MRLLITIATAALVIGGSSLRAQPASTVVLGTVRLPQAVSADGKSLPATTYQVRLTTTGVSPVVGQTPAQSRWVEFVKGGSVVGREVATVVPADDMRTIAKMPRKGGAVRVETLKGGDYLRLWIIHGGSHYLIHLPTGGK